MQLEDDDLRAWPFRWSAASRLLDTSILRQQGDFFLRRGLNTRRLIAFVGSGTSMAYGRVSWSEFAETQVSGILGAAALCGKLSPPIENLLGQLRGLHQRVRREKPDAILLALQIAEQIWMLADHTLLERLLIDFYPGQEKHYQKILADRYQAKPQGERERFQYDCFRKALKAETFDEKHHIRRIFSDPFRGAEQGIPADQPIMSKGDAIHEVARQAFTHDALERNAGPRRSYADVFSKATIQAVRDGLRTIQPLEAPSKSLLHLSKAVANHLFAECERQSHRSLNPVNYSALGLCIDTLRAAGQAGTKIDPAIKTIAAEIEAGANAELSPGRRRTAFVSRDKDPLWHLAMTLDIRRFATVNYDLEIEHLMDDIGFDRTSYEAQEQIDAGRVEQIGPLGGRAREIVLNDKNAAELLDFAASPGPFSLQVAHLHGRATDSEDIVVTERDYQDKYLGDEQHKIITREGLSVLFGGNPLVFVGVSLSEGDVVRPLREFASNRSRRNHSIIALMPGRRDKTGRDRFVMDQFIRHGIYVLYYGKQTVSGREPEFWLNALFDFTKALTELVDNLAAENPPSGETKAKTIAARVVRGKILPKTDTLANYFKDLKSDHASCGIALECELLDAIWHFLKKDQGSLRIGDPSGKWSAKFYGTVLRRAIKRIEGALITAALSSYLVGIEKRWHSWAADAQRDIRTRLNKLQFATRFDLEGAEHDLFKTQWYRHLINERQSDDQIWQEVVRNWRGRYVTGSELEGSQILVVAAARGAGKGSLHGQLTRHGGHLLSGSSDLSSEAPQHYAGVFSASFSFSSEIASVWDALTAFLINPSAPAHATFDKAPEFTNQAGRIERLRYAVQMLGKRQHIVAPGHGQTGRVLIIFQAFDLLFGESGEPKNAEIRAIFDTLFDTKLRAPIDFILLVRSNRLPLYFASSKSGNGRSMRFIEPLKPENALQWRAECITAIINSGARVDLRGSTEPLNQLIPNRQVCDTDRRDYLYFLSRPTPQPWKVKTGPDYDHQLAMELLSPNRFHLSLYEEIARDMQLRKDDSSLRDMTARSMIDAAGREGHVSSDRLLEKILDYWAARPFLPGTDTDVRQYLMEHDHWADAGGTGRVLSDDEVIQIAHDYTLPELLLRHLAVISQPVEADVLAACPRIRSRLSALSPKLEEAASVQEDRLRIVECGLGLLSRHGLCFTIVSRGGQTKLRYQVHRLVQLHIYRRLGGQSFEPPEGYFFSVSLYASQGRGLPLLSANAYAFLNELMNGLIGFPKDDGSEPAVERPMGLQARCLRAGIGIARTLFSIGVVARFNDLDGINVPLPPRPGYFEHHRLTLRWMLSEAIRLDSDDIGDWLPYYPDELAWLYNECGVFSLAQGQLFDALTMFDSALRIAKRIEGDGDKPIRRRIILNLAVCAINRGRPNEARRLLHECTTWPEKDQIVLLLAEGYSGVLEHLGGDHEAALRHYHKAIKGLTRLGRHRASGLFLRHRGDLYRHRKDYVRATQDFAKAIDETGLSGSKDMTWFAIVARIKIEIAQSANPRNALKQLEAAERYADAMEMHELTAEVSFVHAQMLLRQGETALAAERVTRAIRIATLNGLTVRAIAYRSLLADIHQARGWEVDAAKIKSNALEAARLAGYRVLLQRHPADVGPDGDESPLGLPSAR